MTASIPWTTGVSRSRDFDAIVAALKAATRASLIALIHGEQCTPKESMRLQAAFRAEWAVRSQCLRACAVRAERHYENPGALFRKLPLDTLGLLEVPPGRVGETFAWFVRFNSTSFFFFDPIVCAIHSVAAIFVAARRWQTKI